MVKAQCLECGDIIQSMHRHDFVRCECGKSFVDGGEDYFRAGGYIVAVNEEGLTDEDFVAKLDEWS
jgi:acetone carboxylase gamma subunit